MEGIEKLIGFWKNFDCSPSNRSRVHEGDAGFLEAHKMIYPGPDLGRTAVEDFFHGWKMNDNRFHVSMMPVPYLGNLRAKSTDIFILLLNPGVGYSDYGTNACIEFRRALEQNIKQDFTSAHTRCLALDRHFWWSSWFMWYERMLRPIVCEYAGKDGSYLAALDALADRLAVIQLVPYYSSNADKINLELTNSLGSAKVAIGAARELVGRAERGEALVVVRWGASRWRNDDWTLADCEHVVCNGARWLQPSTRNAILNWLQAHPVARCD